MTDGFILMKSGTQWNLVRVENGDGEAKGAILARPLAERIAVLLNRFGEEETPLPIDESEFAPAANPPAVSEAPAPPRTDREAADGGTPSTCAPSAEPVDVAARCAHWTCMFCKTAFRTLREHNEHHYSCLAFQQDEDA